MAVSRLRRALGDAGELLKTAPGGYILEVDDEQLDYRRFERLLDEGGAALRAGRPDQAISLLSSALDLWCGPPLADVGSESFAQGEIARLEELRLSAIEERVEAGLALGMHAP